jgi:hypothetical protein
VKHGLQFVWQLLGDQRIHALLALRRRRKFPPTGNGIGNEPFFMCHSNRMQTQNICSIVVFFYGVCVRLCVCACGIVLLLLVLLLCENCL